MEQKAERASTNSCCFLSTTVNRVTASDETFFVKRSEGIDYDLRVRPDPSRADELPGRPIFIHCHKIFSERHNGDNVRHCLTKSDFYTISFEDCTNESLGEYLKVRLKSMS